jgi:hypothetical protein
LKARAVETTRFGEKERTEADVFMVPKDLLGFFG